MTTVSPPSSAAPPSLMQLEEVASTLYAGGSNDDRRRANEYVQGFLGNLESISTCRMLLEASGNQYALYLGARSLLTLITTFYHSLSLPQANELRNYLLNILSQRCSNLPQVVIPPLISCICRLLKLGWRIEPNSADTLNDIAKFLNATPTHHRIGLQLMNELTVEMSENQTGESHIEHRKTVRSFRDFTLLPILQLALTSLRQLAQITDTTTTSVEERMALIHHALNVVIHCFSFDFIGTTFDDSADEFGITSLQIPASWRTVLEDPPTITLFFDLIPRVNASNAAQCMEVIASFASVRRTIFTVDDRRIAYLTLLVRGLNNALTNHPGLLVHDNQSLHATSIALSRLKANYPLADLIRIDGFEDLLKVVAQLTITAFKTYSETSNSVHYLLSIWTRIASEVASMKQESAVPKSLMEFLPQISTTFIGERLNDCANAIDANRLEDVFTETQLSDQLKYLAPLSRMFYPQFKAFVQGRWQWAIETYRGLAQQPNNDPRMTRLCEAHMALLLYIVAAVVVWEKDNPLSTREEQDTLDAELCTWYYHAMPVVEFRISSRSQPTVLPDLACASLSFLQEFRRRFLAHITPTSKATGDSSAQGQSNANSMSDATNAISTDNSNSMGDTISTTQANTSSSTAMSSSPTNLASFLSTVGNTSTLVFPVVPYVELSPLTPLLSSAVYYTEDDGLPLGGYAFPYSSPYERSTKFFARLTSMKANPTGGPMTQSVVIAHMLNTCLLYLNYFDSSEAVVSAALDLLENLSLGYASSQLLSQSEPIRKVLTSHQFDAFPFLARAGASRARLHTSLYLIIGRVLFKAANLDNFDTFMVPFEQTLDALNGMTNLRTDMVATAAIAVSRKLQGLFEATNSMTVYNMIFDWFCPNYTAIFLRILETWWDRADVASSLLRLFAELAFNRSQRVRFDWMSPNGVILFRECSKLIGIYSARILNVQPETTDELYKHKIKGLTLTLMLMSRSLAGAYCNFGIMELYKDAALSNTLKLIIQTLLSIRLHDLLSYPQLASHYFSLIEILFRQHLPNLLELDLKVILAMLASIHESLQGFNSAICAHSASAIDSLYSWQWEMSHKKRPPPSYRVLVTLLGPANNSTDSGQITNTGSTGNMTNPAGTGPQSGNAGPLMAEIFATLLTLYLFDSTGNTYHYTLSRPIFSMLCVQPALWSFFGQRLISFQNAEFIPRLNAALSEVTKGVEFSLDHTHREMFTQRLAAFKTECLQYCVRPT